MQRSPYKVTLTEYVSRKRVGSQVRSLRSRVHAIARMVAKNGAWASPMPCCPRACTASAITDCSPTAIAPPISHGRASCSACRLTRNRPRREQGIKSAEQATNSAEQVALCPSERCERPEGEPELLRALRYRASGSANPARAASYWDRAYRPCERTRHRARFSCRCQNRSRIRPGCASQFPTPLRPPCRGSGDSARRDRRP